MLAPVSVTRQFIPRRHLGEKQDRISYQGSALAEKANSLWRAAGKSDQVESILGSESDWPLFGVQSESSEISENGTQDDLPL